MRLRQERREFLELSILYLGQLLVRHILQKSQERSAVPSAVQMRRVQIDFAKPQVDNGQLNAFVRETIRVNERTKIATCGHVAMDAIGLVSMIAAVRNAELRYDYQDSTA